MSVAPASQEDFARTVSTIAARLGETDPQVQRTIGRIVRQLGAETALALVEEALAVEAQGGMLLPDLSRRRTLGGVFFVLVKFRTLPRERGSKSDIGVLADKGIPSSASAPKQ